MKFAMKFVDDTHRSQLVGLFSILIHRLIILALYFSSFTWLRILIVNAMEFEVSATTHLT